MFARLRYLLGWILSVFRSRDDLVLESLALRQQLLALDAKRPRPRLGALDKLFWILLRQVWSGWKRSLILVTPETVVRWHRAGFRLYWSWISRARKAVGRKSISRDVRDLIFRMVAENPTWGAPRIHGELLKLEFVTSGNKIISWPRLGGFTTATRSPRKSLQVVNHLPGLLTSAGFQGESRLPNPIPACPIAAHASRDYVPDLIDGPHSGNHNGRYPKPEKSF